MNRLLFYLLVFFLPYAKALAQTAQEDKRITAEKYLDEARNNMFNNFEESQELLRKADSIAKELQENDLLALVSYRYAVAYYIKGDYEASLQHFLKAQKLFRKVDDPVGLANCLVGEGLIQQGIDRNEEAINLFKKGIAVFEKSGNADMAHAAYLNIAISEIELEELDAAEYSLQKAIHLARKAERVDIVHMSLNKLGQIYFLREDYPESINYYNNVLKDSIKPTAWEKSFANAGIAHALKRQGKYDLAEEHALKAMEHAKNVQSLWDLERNTRILSRIYDAQGELDEAYEYLQLNQRYKDSLYNQTKLRQINLLQLESNEAENARLQYANEVAEKQLFMNRIVMISLIVVAAFLLLLLLLFVKNNRNRKLYNVGLEEKNATIVEQNNLISQQNRDLKELNKAKDRLFSILSHDLRGPISSIQQLLELMNTGNFSAEEQKMLLGEMLHQVTETSAMLQNLLHWANTQLEGTKVNPEKIHLPQKVNKVVEVYALAAKNKNIHIDHQIPEGLAMIKVDVGQLMVILHNLMSNAIKFTLEEKSIEISYAEEKGFVILKIKDGGRGISEEKIKEIKSYDSRMISEFGTNMETGTGLGLMLVKQFLSANNAKLDIKSFSGEGAEFIVSFPKTS